MGAALQAPPHPLVAAVDLGSNSFRLEVCRVVDGQIYALDSLKETVRLGAGLGPDKHLDAESRQRALACLARFSERLRGLPPEAVRVVGTNTLRVAKNAAPFIREAEATLGFPIEIIAGHEEARLIYIGVARSLRPSAERRLVVDVGGGSTEVIIGVRHKPIRLESLYMGCVSFSRRFFPEGKVTAAAMHAAELAAGAEVETLAAHYTAGQWGEAIGSSGTARALADLCLQNGLGPSGITAAGLARITAALVKAGDYRKLPLVGLREDRAPVLPGGLSIMNAVFRGLGIEHMTPTDSGLREGVMYDMLGRFEHKDVREATVRQFMQRYHVDPQQAERVRLSSEMLYRQIATDSAAEHDTHYLSWAARLHEIGLSIAYSGFHKHSAYIIEHADMPGFSRMEQLRLGLLLLAQRGTLTKVAPRVGSPEDWRLILALRLGALFHRARTRARLPALRVEQWGSEISLELDGEWLEGNPLTEANLDTERDAWRAVGFTFAYRATEARSKARGANKLDWDY
jgi:exopolyphosphatase / guanosine-5'-triphosphate,3'-diphosphate pyrophosphatase